MTLFCHSSTESTRRSRPSDSEEKQDKRPHRLDRCSDPTSQSRTSPGRDSLASIDQRLVLFFIDNLGSALTANQN